MGSVRIARSPWGMFFVRRIGSLVISIWMILTLVFFLARAIGGDAVRVSAGINATPEYVAQRRLELGLDDPLLEQYLRFLREMIALDLGHSISTSQSVLEQLAVRFPFTAQLALLSFAVAVLVALPLGMSLAVAFENGRRPKSEALFNGVTGLFASLPDYLVGVGLIALFAVTLRLLPAAGGTGPAAYILPVATVALGIAAILSRLVKSETSRVLREDYVRTARGNRLPPSAILSRYVLPNVLTATLTYGGLLLASLLGGTIITETVFGWPGIGSLLIDSIRVYDYPMTQGIVLVIAFFSLLLMLAVDVILAIVDPRSRLLEN